MGGRWEGGWSCFNGAATLHVSFTPARQRTQALLQCTAGKECKKTAVQQHHAPGHWTALQAGQTEQCRASRWSFQLLCNLPHLLGWEWARGGVDGHQAIPSRAARCPPWLRFVPQTSRQAVAKAHIFTCCAAVLQWPAAPGLG